MWKLLQVQWLINFSVYSSQLKKNGRNVYKFLTQYEKYTEKKIVHSIQNVFHILVQCEFLDPLYLQPCHIK